MRLIPALRCLAAALLLLPAAGAAQAQSAITLVSNAGQAEAGGCFFVGRADGWTSGMPFTTGDNSAGYTLSEIDLKLDNEVDSGLRVSIYSTDSSGHPDSSLHVLSNPASLTLNAFNTFTAGAGATLAANTTYAIVLESTGAGNPTVCFSHTNSDDEDSGGQSGWSIADNRLFKSSSATSWNTAISMGLLRIKGTLGGHNGAPSTPPTPVPDTTPPRLTGAAVSGDTLRLNFNERLDPASVPAAAAFAVTVDGTSGPPAAVALSGRTVILTLAEAVEPGAAVTVGYTPGGNPLRDAAGNAVLAFSGRPVRRGTPDAQRRVLTGTLAAVAAQTVSGALDTIGARLGDAVPATRLTLAREPVPLGAPGAGAAAADAAACPLGGTGRRRDSGGFGRDGCAGPFGGAWSRGAEGEELLRDSSFSLALGAAPGDEGFDPFAPRWSAWARAGFDASEGRPESGMRYRGEARTGWVGVDARAGRWVAGLAASHSESEADYSFDGGDDPAERGRLETVLNALHPYGRLTLGNGLELRGMLGVGTGRLRHVPGGGEPEETSRLTMSMASVGLRRKLPPLAGLALAARGDMSAARIAAEGGGDTLGGLRADVWRGRAGVEASRRFEGAGGAAFTPFVELAARRDGGDGPAGTGLEVEGGARHSARGVEIEARGRFLAAHSREGTRERGLSVTMRLRPEADGRGLSMSLSPRWGAGTGGADALWREEMPKSASQAGAETGALDARLGYGFGLPPAGLLTPFAEGALAGRESRRVRLGVRFDAARIDLGVELAAQRRQGGAAPPDDEVRLDLGLRF